MEKNKAIPEGFMTVGQLAKKMGTTVRTLQYYDKEGLLSPSAESEGGRRLYSDKDVIRLHQIQSLKYLGFSLDDIKNRLANLDTPEDVAAVLTEQAMAVKEKIASLSEVLQSIERLRAETLQMKTVDFKKYADIIVNLQMKNEYYGLIKHFDDTALEHLRSRFDMDSGMAAMNTMNQLCDEASILQKVGTPPKSEQGQTLAKAWWDMIMEFTGGDMSILPSLIKFAEKADSWDEEWKEKWLGAEPYIQKALEIYFIKCGIDPFEGVAQ